MSEGAIINAGFGCTDAGSQVLYRHLKNEHIFSINTQQPGGLCHTHNLFLHQVLWHYTVTQPHKVVGGGGHLLEPSHAPLAEAICLQTGCYLTNVWMPALELERRWRIEER